MSCLQSWTEGQVGCRDLLFYIPGTWDRRACGTQIAQFFFAGSCDDSSIFWPSWQGAPICQGQPICTQWVPGDLSGETGVAWHSSRNNGVTICLLQGTRMTTNSHHTLSLESPFASVEALSRAGDAGAKSDKVTGYLEIAMSRRNEAGQALVLTALLLVVLMGFAGLAIDMGVMRYEKRLQQTAADAAAIAGASNLGFGDVVSGAQDAATRVGFTDNGGGQVSNCAGGAAVGTVCVQVNNPPNSGPHQGNSGYVEALVAEVHPTYFMKILSINTETITARAVAANLGSATGNGCMYVMGLPNEGVQGLDISGNAILNASNCRIVDVGNYNNTGGTSTISAYSISVSGNSTGGGSGGSVTCVATGACPTFGIPASGDPFQFLPAPPVQTPSNPAVTTSGIQTLQPGTYPSITIGAGSTVTFNPGIYYITAPGSVSFAGPATVRGSGVMFYLQNGSGFSNGASIDTIAGTQVSNIQLSAPTSGPYAGILIFQDPNDFQNARIGGDSNSFFEGALYFPEGQLTLFGGAGGGFNVAIVDADQVILGNNTVVNLQGSAALPSGVNLITNATIVE